MFRILAKPVDNALVVAPEKVKPFLNEKADPKVKERLLRNAERFRTQCKKDDRYQK